MTVHPNRASMIAAKTAKKLRAAIAATLCVVLLGETAFAYKPQTSLWTERKTTKPVVIASVAGAATPANPSALRRLISDIAPSSLTPASRSLSSRLPAGFLAQVHVKKAVSGQNKGVVVILEDVHQNVEAQKRISAALRALAAEPGSEPVDVALEGAVGGFRFDIYHRFPDAVIASAVADSFLNSGDLAGPSHAGFTAFPNAGQRGLRFVGADDPVRYVRNVQAYKAASLRKADARTAVSRRALELSVRRATTFSQDLLTFDAAAERHHRGEMPLGDYVAALARFGAPKSPSLDRFAQAYATERRLDLSAVERERRQVLEKLVSRLKPAEIDGLLALTLGYRQGSVTFGGYYEALNTLCRRHDVDLSRTPAFDAYLRYVILSDGIEADALFAAVETAEAAVYARLADSDEAKTLAAGLRQVRLAERIVDFALTSSDWTFYKAGKPALNLDLSAFEAFYTEAGARDAAMAGATAKNRTLSVLVSGGFHTEAVAAEILRSGRSVVVCSPRLTKVDLASASAYLSVFDREKTALERVFSGEKLFLASSPAGAVRQLVATPDPAPEMARTVMAVTFHRGGNAEAASQAASDLGASATDLTVSREDGTTVIEETVGEASVRTVVSPADKNAPDKGERRVGDVDVSTELPGSSKRSIANRLGLSSVGAVISLGGLLIVGYSASVGVPAILIATYQLLTVFGLVWTGVFTFQAVVILLASNREMTHPLIPEFRDRPVKNRTYRGGVASVNGIELVLSGYYFDVKRNLSRFSPAQQRSILNEEARHLRYRNATGTTMVKGRWYILLVIEEVWVNTALRVYDMLTGRDNSRVFLSQKKIEKLKKLGLEEEAIAFVLERLELERRTPGSQTFEEIVFISDEHGDIDSMDDLILDRILSVVKIKGIQPIDTERVWTVADLDAQLIALATEGGITDVSNLAALKGKLHFQNLAALLDESRHDATVAARAKEFIAAGLEFKLDPDRTIDAQMAGYGFSLESLKGKLFFHNIGDFMDRGPFGIKIFRRSAELLEADLSDFVPGNHDYWVLANLFGFHLPFYKGYNLHGYKDGREDVHGDMSEVLRKRHEADSLLGDNTVGTTLDRKWWAERLADYQSFHKERQEKHWKAVAADPVKAMYERLVKLGNLSKEQQDAWDRLRGNKLGGEVYMGSRDVGGMSTTWWATLLKDLKNEYREIQPQGDAAPTEAQQIWLDAIQLVETEIVPVVNAEVDQALSEGKWYVRVFQALNDQNYTTAEWWAKDWVFHEGWGPTVLKELTAILQRELGDPSIQVTTKNYLDNPVILQVTQFFKKNFMLYGRDIHQNTYMHAFLPVDMQESVNGRTNPGYGEFFFTYKGVAYRGKGRDEFPSVWDGLDEISKDIRELTDPAELAEAFTLVNSWYADNTTLAKPGTVSDVLQKVGADVLAAANGFNRLFTGHIPLHEFKKQQKTKGVPTGMMTAFRILFTDGGAAEKFGYRGFVIVSNLIKGLFNRGRESKENRGIYNNARTIENAKDVKAGETAKVLFENRGIDNTVYEGVVQGNLMERLKEIKETVAAIRNSAKRSVANRIGLTAVFLTLTALSAIVLFTTGVEPGGAIWMSMLTVSLLFVAGTLKFVNQWFWMARAARRDAPWVGLARELRSYRDLDLGEGIAAITIGGSIYINRAVVGRLPISQQLSVLREEQRHQRYWEGRGTRRQGILAGFWEEILVNVIMPITDAVGSLRRPVVTANVETEQPDETLELDARSSRNPATGRYRRSGRPSGLGGAFYGASNPLSYLSLASTLDAKSWVAEGGRYEQAVTSASSEAEIVNALAAAAPRGLFFGSRTADDIRNAALTDFARSAAGETSLARRLFQWATLAAYRRSVNSGKAAATAVEASRGITAGLKTSVTTLHINQVGESALKAELDDLEALIVEANANRSDEKKVAILAAVTGEIPEAFRPRLNALLALASDITMEVAVTDDLRAEDGFAYSYEKLLEKALREKALTGADLAAVRALVDGDYESAAFVTYSKIPSQFLADGRLRAIWSVLANIGAGWAPIPVDTLIRAALIAQQQA